MTAPIRLRSAFVAAAVRGSYLAALAVGAAATGQERRPPDLAPLRAAFAEHAPPVCFAVAFADGGEPLCLYRGNDARGRALDAATPLPLGPLVRLLVADAVAVAPDLDAARVVFEVAGRSFTVGELLAGSTRVPELFAWRDAPDVDAAVLRDCAEVAVLADTHFPVSTSGVGELVLLHDTMLGRCRDLPERLRTALGPHAGIDAVPVGELGVDAALALPADAVPTVARAKPEVLRLCLRTGGLADWWQWRIRHTEALPTGARTGYAGSVERHPDEHRWTWRATTPSFAWSIAAYPDRHAVLVVYGAGGPLPKLETPFETALFGEGEDETRLGGRMGARVVRHAFAETRWVSGDGSRELRFNARGNRVQVTLDGSAATAWSLSMVGDHFFATAPALGSQQPSHAILAHLTTPQERICAAFVLVDELARLPRRIDFTRADK